MVTGAVMMTVKDLAYHRNGVSGAGFWVGIVRDDGRDMLVVRVPDADSKPGPVFCFAFDIAMLPNIAFGENSWHGGTYVAVMDKAIAEYRWPHEREQVRP